MDMERIESREDQERERDDVDDRHDRDRDPPAPIDEVKDSLTEYKVCEDRPSEHLHGGRSSELLIPCSVSLAVCHGRLVNLNSRQPSVVTMSARA